MLYGEVITPYSENHTKHTSMNSVARTQNFEMLHLVVHEVTTVIYNAKWQYEWHRLFIVFRRSGKNAGENTGKIKFVKFTVAKI